jgi:Mg/Co/Ni transporter MgtE
MSTVDIVKKLEALPEAKRLEVVRLIDSFAGAASSRAEPGLYERIVKRADKIAAISSTASDAVKDVRELRDERR